MIHFALPFNPESRLKADVTVSGAFTEEAYPVNRYFYVYDKSPYPDVI